MISAENSVPLAKAKIVADGPQRYRDAKGYEVLRRRIYNEVVRRQLALSESRSLWHRLRIEIAVRREVAARLKEEFPSATLHLKSLPR
jgi:hypothetical protein